MALLTSFTQQFHCSLYAFLFWSTTKKFISRLICPGIFLLRGAWKSNDFLQASRKPITSPSKISLLDISFPEDTWRKVNVYMTFRSGQDVFWTSYVRLVYVLCLRGWLNQCKMNLCNFDSWLPWVVVFWKAF